MYEGLTGISTGMAVCFGMAFARFPLVINVEKGGANTCPERRHSIKSCQGGFAASRLSDIEYVVRQERHIRRLSIHDFFQLNRDFVAPTRGDFRTIDISDVPGKVILTLRECQSFQNCAFGSTRDRERARPPYVDRK